MKTERVLGFERGLPAGEGAGRQVTAGSFTSGATGYATAR